MVASKESGESMDKNEQTKVDAWYKRLHSDYNHEWLDIDQLKLITTDTAEDPARVQAACQLLDELQKKGEA